MKKQFSTKWKGSKQPRKKRKYTAKAPLHISRKFLSTNLAKSLRGKYGRNIVVRKGDTVKIMRGQFKGKKGKINLVDLKKSKVAIEGIQRSKRDGTKINILFPSSNLQIQELNSEDKKRFKDKENIQKNKTIKGNKEKKNAS